MRPSISHLLVASPRPLVRVRVPRPRPRLTAARASLSSSTRDDAAWQTSLAGGWQRALDPMEKWVYTNAQATKPTHSIQDNTINIFARVRADLQAYGGVDGFAHSLKRQWLSLCRQQPLLASTVAPRLTRHIPDLSSDPASASRWLARSFHVVDQGHVDGAHGAYGTLPEVHQPTLHYFPATQDILIRTPHYLVDGIGHLMMLERLLHMVSLDNESCASVNADANEQPSERFARLSPTLPVALNLPKPNDAAIKNVEDFIESFQNGHFPPTGLPFRQSQASTQCRKVIQCFSAATSRAILHACKRKGVTITHAVHAAAMIVSQRLNPTYGPEGHYSTGTAFDLRGRCVPPYNGAGHACTVYLLPRFVILKNGQFASTLSQLQSFYRNEWQRPGLSASIVPFLQQMDVLSQKFACGPPISSIGMSSFGDLTRWMSRSHGTASRRLHVDEISIAGEFVAPSVALHLWSWDNKISFQMEWNALYYTAGYMMEYRRAIFDELDAQFGLHRTESMEEGYEVLKLT